MTINKLKNLEEVISEDKELMETVDIYGYEDDPATTRELTGAQKTRNALIISKAKGKCSSED